MKKVIIILGIIVVVGMLVYSFVKYERENAYVDPLVGITYVVPSEFEKSKYGEYYHYYGDDVSCSFDVSAFSTYSYESGKDYLENHVSVYLSDEVSFIEEVDLGGDVWYYFSRKNRGYVYYYYAIVKDDKGYYLEYEINDYLDDYNDNENNFCKASYGEVISSIKLKG